MFFLEGFALVWSFWFSKETSVFFWRVSPSSGAFGAHISPKHAMILGMIPDCNLDKVISAGNAAGTGARIALLNKESRTQIETLVNRIIKIETAMAPNFQTHFVAASGIPNSSEEFPKLKNVVSLPNVNFNQRNNISC